MTLEERVAALEKKLAEPATESEQPKEEKRHDFVFFDYGLFRDTVFGMLWKHSATIGDAKKMLNALISDLERTELKP